MIPLRDDNPSYSFPFFTIILIIVNVVAFIMSMAGGEFEFVRVLFTYGFIPAELLKGEIVTSVPSDMLPEGYAITNIRHVAPMFSLFTSMFLHGDWMHLIGNMWFLWLFGDNVEDRMGSFRFLFFYLIAGIIAGLAHAFVSASSVIPAIGASGAISGVIGAYFVMYPTANIQTLWFLFFFPRVVSIPAIVFLGLWFIMQVWSGFMTLGMESAGVAFFAHIGGFIAGLLLVKLFARRQYVQVRRSPEFSDRYNRHNDDMWY